MKCSKQTRKAVAKSVALFSSGVELIAAERQRQISKEGYDSSHDDDHDLEEIALAAACYALPPQRRKRSGLFKGMSQWREYTLTELLWPWREDDWKPSNNRIRELTKAGALIAAEIDRLQREGG